MQQSKKSKMVVDTTNTKINSQFPFWDFGECNYLMAEGVVKEDVDFSQFPLWDFGECNRCRFGCFSGNWRGNQRVPPLTPLLQQPL
jgi:hypothetical protein